MDTNVTCPVCTLYLRKGITLEDHLQTHPKDKVIEALISLVSNKPTSNSVTSARAIATCTTTAAPTAPIAPTTVATCKIENNFVPFQNITYQIPPPWQQENPQYSATNQSILLPLQTNNSSIIYQQFVNNSNPSHPSANCVPVSQIVPQYLTIPTAAFGSHHQTTYPQSNSSIVTPPCLFQSSHPTPPQVQIVATPVSLGTTSSYSMMSQNCTLPQIVTTTVTTETVKSVSVVSATKSQQKETNQKSSKILENEIQPQPVIPTSVPTSVSAAIPVDPLAAEDDTHTTSRPVEYSNTKRISQTNSVSQTVSTIQLADITISTGGISTKTATDQDPLRTTTATTNSTNSREYGQMEIIPIYKKSSISQHENSADCESFIQISKVPNTTIDSSVVDDHTRSAGGSGNQNSVDKTLNESSSSGCGGGGVAGGGGGNNETSRKRIIEIYSNKSSSHNLGDNIINCDNDTINCSRRLDENVETITPDYQDEEEEEEDNETFDEHYQQQSTTNSCTERIEQNTNTISSCQNNDADDVVDGDDTDDDNDNNINQQTYLPEVTFYQIPKIEDVSGASRTANISTDNDSEQLALQTVEGDTMVNMEDDVSPNDIIIIKNEVICTSSANTTATNTNDKHEIVTNEINQNNQNSLMGVERTHRSNIVDNYTTKNDIYHNFNTELVDAMNVVEFDGIKLMLNTDLINISVTPAAERNLHCNENIREKSPPPILLNIGEIISPNKSDETIFSSQQDDVHDENLSRDSLNIRADERMPPKGELSEQESNGANDEMWGKVFQEGSSGISTSYDLLARESWGASDSSDSEPSTPSLHHQQNRVPSKSSCSYTNSGTNGPNKNSINSVVNGTTSEEYKCSMCDEIFLCPKERRVHQTKVHGDVYSETSNMAMTTTTSSKEEDISEYHSYSKIKIEENEFCDNFKKVFEQDLNERTSDETKLEADEPFLQILQRYCDLCNMEFTANKQFIQHYRDKHKDLPVPRYQCKVCKMSFALEYKFTEHLKIHPLACTFCFKYFYRRQNLRLHLKRHLGVKTYKCDVCKKPFITKQKKLDHENIHRDIAPYKCNFCHNKFRRHSNLIQHRKTRHSSKKKSRDYLCHCGELFKTKKRFMWHSEIHDAKPKACTYCSEKFIHVSSLTRHMRKAHNTYFVPDPKRESENVPCPICKKIYLKSSLDVHMKIHSGVKPFSCNICNKEFTTKWNLKLHRWTHAARGSKPYKCSLCQSAFIRHSDYVAHMNSHRNIKPYTCNHCGRQFIRKYNCQRHVKEHEHEKSFKCTICNKEFHRSYYLREHLKVHSGARPYACHICGKTSSTKSNHNKHVRIHHAREPVSTEN